MRINKEKKMYFLKKNVALFLKFCIVTVYNSYFSSKIVEVIKYKVIDIGIDYK